MHTHKCETASNVHGALHVQVPAVHDKFIAVSQLTAGDEVVLQEAPPRPTFLIKLMIENIHHLRENSVLLKYRNVTW